MKLRDPIAAMIARRWLPALLLGCIDACDSKKHCPEAPISAGTTGITPVLQAARSLPANESLRLLCEQVPVASSPELFRAIEQRLLTTNWQREEFSVATGMRVDHLWTDGASTWAALSDDRGSMALRMTPDSDQPLAFLFPSAGEPIRGWKFSPNGQRVLIERNRTLLLCDAHSMRPIRALPTLPRGSPPECVADFSEDSLLFAHASMQNGKTYWTIRDADKGEPIRKDPLPTGTPLPVAGSMTRQGLDLLQTDGQVLHIPLNPTAPPASIVQDSRCSVLLATPCPQSGFLALARSSPDDEPSTHLIDSRFPANHEKHGDKIWSVTVPWTRMPSVWRSGYRVFDPRSHPIPPDATAMIQHSGGMVSADSCGVIRWMRNLPPLAGEFCPDLPYAEFPKLDPNTLTSACPTLDFQMFRPAKKQRDHRRGPLIRSQISARMDRAFARENCAGTAEVFAKAQTEEVMARIQSSGTSGVCPAHCLFLSLMSPHPEWIAHCLANYTDLPDTLKLMARTRIFWLLGQHAEALNLWPDPFPSYDEIRTREDWNHWESADFHIPYEQIRQSVAETLDSYRLTEDADANLRARVYDRLTSETAIASLGRGRYAAFCLDAAMLLAMHEDEAARSLVLSNAAMTMGAPPAPCLRAEAIALAARKDYEAASSRWIRLISHFPVSAHRPADYSEAAYCAFENDDTRQAMALLATGIHRFPDDSSFSLRAAWIALLTGHDESAWRFLLKGQQAGFRKESQAHALALLSIASHHCGAKDESAAYHAELIRLDPQWNDPTSIDRLDWPEPLRATLRELSDQSFLTPDR